MCDKVKAKAIRHFNLQPLDLLVNKLNDTPTTGTNNMIVMLFVPHDLVPGNAVAKVNRSDQPSFQKQLQRAVRSRVPNGRHRGRRRRKHLVEAEVRRLPKYDLEQHRALPG